MKTFVFLMLCLVAFPVVGQEVVSPTPRPSLQKQIDAIAKLSISNGRVIDRLKAGVSVAPDAVEDPTETVSERGNFRRTVRRAIREQVRSGAMTRRDGLKLNVAMFSPSFSEQAENLAITQMVFSGDAGLPMNSDGKVERANIDWDKFFEFLKVFLPFLMDLLTAIG